MKKGTLYAASFDSNRLAIRGVPTPVLEQVSNSRDFGHAQLDLSIGGSLLYHKGGTVGLRTIHWLDAAGNLETLLGEPGMYTSSENFPRRGAAGVLCPRGIERRRLVYSWRTGTRTRLTEGAGQNAPPVWSPDGKYLVLGTTGGIFWVPADGGQGPRPPFPARDERLFPRRSRPMERRSPSPSARPTASTPYASRRCGTDRADQRRVSRNSLWTCRPAIRRRRSLRMDAGWRMRPLNQACSKCTCGRFPTPARNA